MRTSTYFLILILLLIFGITIGFIFSTHKNNLANPNSYSGNLLSIENSSGDYNALAPEISLASPINIEESASPITIKSVYLTGWSAGSKSKRQAVIENFKKYGFNAVVIDIKDEAGQVSYKSNVQTAIDISSSKNMISDIQTVIQEFHDADIYVIGRIVTFKDPVYAKKIPENAYHKEDGSLWQDYSGNNWPNPYNKASWNYPIELAKEAASLGFDEIQFDYIRFPSSEGKTKQISYGFQSETQSKSDTINAFLKEVMEELKDYTVVVSADVFGITTKKLGDFEHIGQDLQAIAQIVDVICPMIYPSHYGFGEYGVRAPDTQPYKIVYSALKDAKNLYFLTSGDIKLATIRPYLQDFTASWLKKGNYISYGTKAVTAQLQACYDLDIKDFTLWDPNNKYSYEALQNIIESISGEILNSGEIVTSSDVLNSENIIPNI